MPNVAEIAGNGCGRTGDKVEILKPRIVPEPVDIVRALFGQPQVEPPKGSARGSVLDIPRPRRWSPWLVVYLSLARSARPGGVRLARRGANEVETRVTGAPLAEGPRESHNGGLRT